MLVRDVGLTLQALEERIVVTCAADLKVVRSTAGTTSTDPNVIQSCVAAGGVNGIIFDRRGFELRGRRFRVAEPFAYLWATRGSTEADRKLTLGLKLQHGDSSGLGDAADYSTGSQPVDQTFFSTARVSDSNTWTSPESTGAFYGRTRPAYYNLTAAKRYLRVVPSTSKNRVTTETSGDEEYHFGAAIRFGAADELPYNELSTAPWATATATA